MTKREKGLCSVPGCHNKAEVEIIIIRFQNKRLYCALHSCEVMELIVENIKASGIKRELERLEEAN